MSKFPRCKPAVVLRALLRAGFHVHHHTGSHAQLRQPTKPRLRVTIPYHTHFDLPPKILSSILQQAEMTVEEFLLFL